jgi:hypothetical protein
MKKIFAGFGLGVSALFFYSTVTTARMSGFDTISQAGRDGYRNQSIIMLVLTLAVGIPSATVLTGKD